MLASTASYFEALGVSAAVDEATLNRRFRELLRRYHPDRFATADPQAQADAEAAAAQINDAYRTLRDPFARAAYLLRQERGARPDDLRERPPAPELFERLLELQETLMAFEEGDTTRRPALEAARSEYEADCQALEERLDALFGQFDAGQRDEALDGIAQALGVHGYLRRMRQNLERALA